MEGLRAGFVLLIPMEKSFFSKLPLGRATLILCCCLFHFSSFFSRLFSSSAAILCYIIYGLNYTLKKFFPEREEIVCVYVSEWEKRE